MTAAGCAIGRRNRLPTKMFLSDMEELSMADDKTQTDRRDRSHVAGVQVYEVQYLTEQTGISAEQAREIIRAYGNDRDTLLKAAKAFASAGAKVRSSRL